MSIRYIQSLPTTKMLLVLLLPCTELLISAPKIITFLPNPPFGCKKVSFESNPIPYPEYLYLLISSFFVNLAVPNRQFSRVTLFVLVVKGLNL